MYRNLLAAGAALLLPLSLFAAYPAASYTLSADGKTLVSWKGSETTVDMNSDPALAAVTTIDDNAFHSKGVQSVVVGNNVTSIGRFAFMDCSSLTSVTLPAGLTTLKNAVFSGCSSLTSVNIPAGVTTLSNSLFYGCSSLPSIALPSGLTAIGDGVFSDCSALTGVTLPEGLLTLGDEAFSACSSLTSMALPQSLTAIGSSTFEQCAGMTSVTFGPNITEIGSYAFDGTGLTSVDMSPMTAGVSFYANVFNECNSLVSVVLPANPSSVGSAMFNNCKALKSITVPDTWEEVPVKFVYGCSALESFDMGTGVETVKNTAFFGCSSLSDITWSPALTRIDWNVFCDCASLTVLNLPENLETVDDYAFNNLVSLTSVIAGSKVTSFGQECFSQCPQLSSFSIAAVTPPTLGSYCFYNTNVADATLYVPASAISAYSVAEQWKDFGTVADAATGIRDLDAAAVAVWPNPAGERISFGTVADAVLYDMNGRTAATAANADSMDVTAVAAGQYVLRLNAAGKTSSVRVIIK